MVFVPAFVPSAFLSMYMPAIYAGLIVGFIATMAIAMKREEQQMVAYEAPQVEVIEVEVEKGFAISGQWFDNEQDWDKA